MDSEARRSRFTPRIATYIAIVATCLIAACGSDQTEQSPIDRAGILVEGTENAAQTRSTPTPPAAANHQRTVTQTSVDIASSDAQLSVADIENLPVFKKSKTYDIEGLTGAEHAIYGFFGPDPYDRREIEIRFYPDHATALDQGVDFAEEATGPNATLSSRAQRWDEGITQRRGCRANTRGSHHTGRCDAAKYGDYIVFGNIIALCEGADSEIALRNCNQFADALR